MKQFQPQAGYTIVEVMIFLIISAGLFTAAVSSITLQNRRTQFVVAVNTLQDRLQDVLNDTAIGFYPSSSNFKCDADYANGPHPQSIAGAPEQGSNTDCIFVGKAIQFAPDANRANYGIYTMIGNRLASAGGAESSDFVSAKPVLLGLEGRPGVVDGGALQAGVEIRKVVAVKTHASIGGIAVVSSFGKTTPIDKTVSGTASRVTLAAVTNTTLGSPKAFFAQAVRLVSPAPNVSYSDAEDGILICLREGDNGRKASISIGGEGQLSLENTIDSWPGDCDT